MRILIFKIISDKLLKIKLFLISDLRLNIIFNKNIAVFI